jgi:hypothetical protein
MTSIFRFIHSSKAALLVAVAIHTPIAASNTGCMTDTRDAPVEQKLGYAKASNGKPTQDTPSNPTNMNNQNPSPIESLFQSFDGSTLTEDRARTIVERAGYEYVSFLPCVPASDSCATFNVQEKGENGRPLLFQVQGAADDCSRLKASSTLVSASTAANHNSSASARTSSASRETARSVNQSLGAGQVDHGGQLSQATQVSPIDEREDADGCFDVYPVIMRVIYDGDTSFMAGYASTRLSLIYQTIDGDKWQDQYTVTTGTVAQPWGGGEEHSDYYEVRDANGNLIDSDIETIDLIASSGGSTETLSERCVRVAEGVRNLQEKAQTLFDGLCPSFIPEMSGDSGIGLSISIDLCGNWHSATDVTQEVLMQALAESCEAAPACFLTGYGSCLPADLMIMELAPFFFEWAESGANGTFGTGGGINCPNRRVTNRAVGDTDCIETTTEECDEISGECYCEVTDATMTCGGT